MKQFLNSRDFLASLKARLSFPKHPTKFLLNPKFLVSLSASSLLTYISFNHLISTEIDLIYSQTPQNESLITQIGESLTGKYQQTPYLPFRFMEIIYGNVFDEREYCNYNREVFFTNDGENIALGKLNRLESLRTYSSGNPHCSSHSRINRR